MSLDKPITKYSDCGRGGSRESNISRLYVEMGVWNTELLSLTTSPALVMGQNRSHPLARGRRSHRPAEYSSALNTPAEKPGLIGLSGRPRPLCKAWPIASAIRPKRLERREFHSQHGPQPQT
jgi:hypothetical protein